MGGAPQDYLTAQAETAALDFEGYVCLSLNLARHRPIIGIHKERQSTV